MKLKTLFISTLAASTVAAVAFAGPHRGKMFEQLDTNKDGQVTKAEMQTAAEKHITAADKNGDRAASPDELRARAQAERQAHRANRFSKKDQNGDGALTKDELPQMPPQAFQRLDSDGNGAITQAEFKAVKGKHHGKRNAHDPKKRFDRLDKNSDGKLSREEAAKMPQRRFEQLDKNSDGTLTLAELTAGKGKGKFRKGHGKHMRGADTNQDGNIDVNEARAMAGKRFDRLDKNHNGVLDKEELGKRKGHHAKGERKMKNGKGQGRKTHKGNDKSAGKPSKNKGKNKNSKGVPQDN